MSVIHVVAQGECLAVIARRYGFRSYRTVYEHPDNAELRKRRPNPNVILPGDQVVIPGREQKEAEARTGAVHQFQLRKPRRSIHLVFQDDVGELAAGVPFELSGEGVHITGTTDSEGTIRARIPLDIHELHVQIMGLHRTILLGHLDPAWDPAASAPVISGVQARLANLGYDVGNVDGILWPRTKRALRAYAKANNLGDSGLPSRELIARLETDHGC